MCKRVFGLLLETMFQQKQYIFNSIINCCSLRSSCNLNSRSCYLSSSALKIISSFFVSQIDWLKVSTLNISCCRRLSFTTGVLLHFKTGIFEAYGLLLFPFDKANDKDAKSSLPFVGSSGDKKLSVDLRGILRLTPTVIVLSDSSEK